MAAVSETIVREFFELHGFLIRQNRKFIAPTRKPAEDEDIDFFVLNPRPKPSADTPLPFALDSSDLASIHRAIVVVKGGHTETFSTARLTSAPEIFRFVEPKAFERAARAFGQEGTPLKILVIPSLPQGSKAREESIALLRAKGVDAILPFRTMLAHLVAETKTNRNYQKSDLLQIIRILKNYDFVKEPQLELFKAEDKRGKR